MADDLQNYKLQLQQVCIKTSYQYQIQQKRLQNIFCSLIQVEAALLTDPVNSELLKLKKDLEEVIELTRDLIKTQLEEQKKSAYVEPTTQVAPPTESSVYYDEIEAALIAAEKLVQTETSKVWKIGDKCQAKWTEDGVYYDATIEGITDSGEVMVVFDAYQNRSTTTLKELKDRVVRNEVFPSSTKLVLLFVFIYIPYCLWRNLFFFIIDDIDQITKNI